MGYAFAGVCHQDVTVALNAFKEAVPDVNATGINAFTAQPTISGAGLITWSISNRPLNTTTATTRTGTTQLQTCTTEALDQWPVQSILFYLAVAFAFFVGFKTGFRP